MYALSPSSSFLVGCALKWPVLAPLAFVGITAYTFCAPMLDTTPEPTPVVAPAAPVERKPEPAVMAPPPVPTPLPLPPAKKPKG